MAQEEDFSRFERKQAKRRHGGNRQQQHIDTTNTYEPDDETPESPEAPPLPSLVDMDDSFTAMHKSHSNAYELVGHVPTILQWIDRSIVVWAILAVSSGVVKEWDIIYNTLWLTAHFSLVLVEGTTQASRYMQMKEGKLQWHMSPVAHRLYFLALLYTTLIDFLACSLQIRDLAHNGSQENIWKTILLLLSLATVMYRLLNSMRPTGVEGRND